MVALGSGWGEKEKGSGSPACHGGGPSSARRPWWLDGPCEQRGAHRPALGGRRLHVREKGGRKENELGFGELVAGRGFCPREERDRPSDVDPM